MADSGVIGFRGGSDRPERKRIELMDAKFSRNQNDQRKKRGTKFRYVLDFGDSSFSLSERERDR